MWLWILTRILSCQTTVGGHVDKKNVLARVLIELNVFASIQREGFIFIDGAFHIFVAVHLEDLKHDINNNNS